MLLLGCTHYHYGVKGSVPMATPKGEVDVLLVDGVEGTYSRYARHFWAVTGEPADSPYQEALRTSNHEKEEPGLIEAFEARLPDGWNVRYALPPEDRLDTQCDYRLELREQPGNVPGGLFALSVLNGLVHIFSVALIPWEVPATNGTSEWRVLRCADELQIGRGHLKVADPVLIWGFNTWRHNRLSWTDDPFAVITADLDTDEGRSALETWHANPQPEIDQRLALLKVEGAAWSVYYKDAMSRGYSGIIEYNAAESPPDWAYNGGREGPVTGVGPALVGIVPQSRGPYASPYMADGRLASWGTTLAGGEVAGQLAGAAAGVAADAAIDQVSGSIPYIGGLLGAAAKKGVKDGTSNAVEKLVTKNLDADYYFNTPCDLAVYMHLSYGTRADYVNALQAVFQVYPDVAQQHATCTAGVGTVSAAPAAPAPSSGDNSMAGQLERLQKLHASGALTQEEYSSAKAKLISGGAN
jgi:hypothetical protein